MRNTKPNVGHGSILGFDCLPFACPEASILGALRIIRCQSLYHMTIQVHSEVVTGAWLPPYEAAVVV